MQVGLLRSKFDEALGERARQLVDVSTIDGFQAWSFALTCMFVSFAFGTGCDQVLRHSVL